MTFKGSFAIEGSFNLTGRGLVIYGNIVNGAVNKLNILCFKHEGQELKLKIKEINFLDWITEKVSKVSLTFYYDIDNQKKQMETLQVAKQIAKIESD